MVPDHSTYVSDGCSQPMLISWTLYISVRNSTTFEAQDPRVQIILDDEKNVKEAEEIEESLLGYLRNCNDADMQCIFCTSISILAKGQPVPCIPPKTSGDREQGG